ncbi:C-terminal-binding protein, partial [Orchesella cincta]
SVLERKVKMIPSKRARGEGVVETLNNGPIHARPWWHCWMDGIWHFVMLRAQRKSEKVLNEAVALSLWHTITLTKEDLEKFKALRIIVRIGSGVDNIDVKAAGEIGIAVCNVPGYGIEEVGRHDHETYWLANMVRDGKKFTGPEQVTSISGTMKERVVIIAGWGFARLQRVVGKNSRDTWALCGLGRIGSAVALRAKAFDSMSFFNDPYLPDGIEKSLGVTRSELCLAKHCTLNEHNHHLINEYTLKQMRPGIYDTLDTHNTEPFWLTQHEWAVDELPSHTALREGRIRSAALDVHENGNITFSKVH